MPAATGSGLYVLDEATVTGEYVAALSSDLKQFLLRKSPGHCQRVDYLPRPVMEQLGRVLASDSDLRVAKVVCRVLTDRSGTLEAWESSGSGAVALREDATYGRIKVFCALFPAGLRLAEEDSLNVATFKTDDAESFDARKCILAHLNGKVNLLPTPEKDIMRAILDSEVVRSRDARLKLRYVLAVLGEKTRSARPIDWEVAGAYLYEAELIPDFALAPDILGVQLVRNLQCVSVLTDGEKNFNQNQQRLVDEKGLDDEDRRREIAVYLSDKNTLRPDEWLPPICHDEAVREKLSFDTWKFAEATRGIKVELKPLQDPKKPDKVASGLVVQSGALTNDGKKPIQIKWSVSPKDSTDLGGFRVFVLRKTEEQGDIDVIPPQSITAKRASFMVPMADNNLEPDEKCVARIRIQAVNKSGAPISDGHDETEEFWIENGEEITTPPSEKGSRLRHLDELMFRVTHKTGKTYEVRNKSWDIKRDHVYSIRLTNNERGDLILNPLLRDVERQILENPNSLGMYEAELINRRRAELRDFKPVQPTTHVNQIADEFWKAREAFFKAVREQEGNTGVIAITDLHAHADAAQVYVQKYLELLKALRAKIEAAPGPGGINTVLHDYRLLMRIDTVLMKVGPADSPMEVVLLSPTHPLRVMWLFQFETFVRSWIDQMDGMAPDTIERRISEDSIDKLVDLNIPNTIAWDQGRVFTNTDNVDLFWSVLPNAKVPDLRTAVNAALSVLGSAGREVVISTVTPGQIASKIERYLCHHPYVRCLKLNVINPGDGLLILEAVERLLEVPLYKDLNFDIKFFAPAGTKAQLIGNAFDDLMEQRDDLDFSRGKTLSDTEERLLQPNANPLFPKLVYAKHTIADLLDDAEGRFESHLTFLIDYFGTTVATRTHDLSNGSSSLHNLLAEYLTDYTPGKTTATWSRLIAPNRCNDLASDGNTGRLFEAHETICHLAACFFDWGKSLDKYTTVQLELTDEHGKHHLKMLRQVHFLSDWVFTIDRNFGIEYYDDPARGPEARESGGYLIDYTPEFLDAVSHRLIISTYHQQEIESILRSGFEHLFTPEGQEPLDVIESHTVARVLQVLKSVSGKLALKLINNPTQAQEVIGLALTRLALGRDDRLAGRVLIPVDSHIDLFHQTPREMENAELTLKRTDLLLVELRERELRIELIEVKNRKYASPQALVELQTEVAKKNTNTEGHFRAHFLGSPTDRRFDADIKNKELANILSFYFERARRYRLFEFPNDAVRTKGAEDQFRKGLESIQAGSCDLVFKHAGFIFNGTSVADVEHRSVHNNDIQIHGRTGIAKLLNLVLDTRDEDPDSGFHVPAIPPGGSPVPPVSPAAPAAPSVAQPPTARPTATGPAPQSPGDEVPAPGSIATPVAPGASGTTPSPAVSSPGPATEMDIYLGKNAITGVAMSWNPFKQVPARLTNQHLLVVGKSGSGKSETTKAIIWELGRRGVPSIIFDFQGEYASGEFFDAVQPQVFNAMDGLPVNPLELPIDPLTGKKKPPIEMVFRLADTLNKVFGGSGEIQLGILREAIEECYVQQGIVSSDPATWDKAPPTLEMLAAVLDHWSHDRGVQVRNLLVRLQPLFKSGIFKQGKTSFTFDDLFQRTTVLLMTSGIKDLMLAASRFMLDKVYAAMLTRGVTRDLRVMVVVDEAHKLCGDETITSLIKEARKYGLGLVLSSQETRDFHPSIFANTGTLISLALEDADASVMANHLGLTEKADQKVAKQIILDQASGEALIRSTHFKPYQQIRVLSFEDRRHQA